MTRKASVLQRIRDVLVERITVGIGGGLLVLGLGTWLLNLLGVVRNEGPVGAVGIVSLLLIIAWIAEVVFVKPFTPAAEFAHPVPTAVPDSSAAGRPPPRNLNFTGREELLKSLHTALTAGATTAVTQAIAGLGGIGKTQLATEYCYRHAEDYKVIWWLRAEDPATLASDYAALAGRQDLPEKNSIDQTQTIAAVHTWLEQNKGWLLVFDNAPGPTEIRDYLPRASSGSVIVTSRHARWGGFAETLEVPVLPRDKSVEFLLRRAKTGDSAVAGQLAEVLGDLPLALEQASAYIEETGTSIAHYHEVLTTGRKEVLTWRSKDAQYPESVARTWQVSFEQLEEESKPAAALMKVAAFLAPDDIPLDLLIRKEASLPEPLTALASDPIKLDHARMALGRFSLARFQGSDMTVHRLVQAVVRDRLKGKAEVWAKAAVVLLDSVFPDASGEVRFWPECARLLSHAFAASAKVDSSDVETERAARILNRAGQYLISRAQFAEAEPALRRALSIREKAHGLDHPEVATSLNNLVALYYAQGQYAQAEPLSERSLAISEKALGPDHPDVATGLNDLAELYRAQGRYAQAEPLYQRSLAVWEKALGPDHPDVATSLNNLAMMYHDQGRYAEAEPLYQRSLAIWEKALGPDHPDAALGLNNLAELYRAQGRNTLAEPLYKRSLTIREKALGLDHPDVAVSLNNLAELYRAQGQYALAEPLCKRSLAIWEKVLGPDHPYVATSLNNLAGLYCDQGQYAQAEPLYQRALAIREKTFGPGHASVAASLDGLAALYRATNRPSEAETMERRAAKTRATAK